MIRGKIIRDLWVQLEMHFTTLKKIGCILSILKEQHVLPLNKDLAKTLILNNQLILIKDKY